MSKGREDEDKTVTDVWFIGVIAPTSNERTGYPTQKPLELVQDLVRVHSNKDDILLDPFAGAGTLSEAAALNSRKSISIDSNKDAIDTMKNRLKTYGYKYE